MNEQEMWKSALKRYGKLTALFYKIYKGKINKKMGNFYKEIQNSIKAYGSILFKIPGCYFCINLLSEGKNPFTTIKDCKECPWGMEFGKCSPYNIMQSNTRNSWGDIHFFVETNQFENAFIHCKELLSKIAKQIKKE